MTARENIHAFEQRKRDHITYALDDQNQTKHLSHFDKVQLLHDALPEINFDDVDIHTESLGIMLTAPFFISSMTAGHHGATNINAVLANVAARKGYLMGVGSQRRELYDHSAASEWKTIRKQAPGVRLLANIGLSQIIKCETDDVKRLCDNLEAEAIFVHCNALQEVIQPEGTPNFKGGIKAIKKLCKALPIPVIVKETGNGFSVATLQKLNDTGIHAVDLSGVGGTHWGRIEGNRTETQTPQHRAAEIFQDWGIASIDTLLDAQSVKLDFELWGSGGVRSGLDAAKMLVLGAKMIGIAKPMLEYALEGEDALINYMECIEYELKTALFCTGCRTIKEFQEKQPWR